MTKSQKIRSNFTESFCEALRRAILDVELEQEGIPVAYYIDSSVIYGAFFPFADFRRSSGEKSLKSNRRVEWSKDGTDVQRWMVRTHLLAGTMGPIRVLLPHYDEFLDLTNRPKQIVKDILRDGIRKNRAVRDAQNDLEQLISACRDTASPNIIDRIYSKVSEISLGSYSILEAISNSDLRYRWRSLVSQIADSESGGFTSTQEIERQSGASDLIDVIRKSRAERYPSQSTSRDGAAVQLLASLISDSSRSERQPLRKIGHRMYCESRHLINCCRSPEFFSQISHEVGAEDLEDRVICTPMELLMRCVFQALRFPHGSFPFENEKGLDEDQIWLVNLSLEELKEIVETQEFHSPVESGADDENLSRLLNVSSRFFKTCLNGMLLMQGPSLKRLQNHYERIEELDSFSTHNRPVIIERINEEHHFVREKKNAARFSLIYSRRVGQRLDRWSSDVPSRYDSTVLFGILPASYWSSLSDHLGIGDAIVEQLRVLQERVRGLQSHPAILEEIRRFLKTEADLEAAYLAKLMVAVSLDIPSAKEIQAPEQITERYPAGLLSLMINADDRSNLTPRDLAWFLKRVVRTKETADPHGHVAAMVGGILLCLHAGQVTVSDLMTQKRNRFIRVAARLARRAYAVSSSLSGSGSKQIARHVTALYAITASRDPASAKAALKNIQISDQSCAVTVARCILEIHFANKGKPIWNLGQQSALTQKETEIVQRVSKICAESEAEVSKIELPAIRDMYTDIKTWLKQCGH